MRLGIARKRRVWMLAGLPLIVVVLFGTGARFVLGRAEEAFAAQASEYANRTFSETVNNCVRELAQSGEYGDFMSKRSDENTDIMTLETDTARINVMKSRLTERVREELEAKYPAVIGIPVGALTGCPLLLTAGWEIPVKIMPINALNSEYNDEFISVGINQSKYKISLTMSTDVIYRGYGVDERETLMAEVPIAETIIVGDVPRYGSIRDNDAE